MKLEEQEALLELWQDFLDGQAPTPAAMREFYFEVVAHSGHYRYGMAPEVFDLLVHGVFDVERTSLWASARRAWDGHQAKVTGRRAWDGHQAKVTGRRAWDGHQAKVTGRRASGGHQANLTGRRASGGHQAA